MFVVSVSFHLVIECFENISAKLLFFRLLFVRYFITNGVAVLAHPQLLSFPHPTVDFIFSFVDSFCSFFYGCTKKLVDLLAISIVMSSEMHKLKAKGQTSL